MSESIWARARAAADDASGNWQEVEVRFLRAMADRGEALERRENMDKETWLKLRAIRAQLWRLDVELASIRFAFAALIRAYPDDPDYQAETQSADASSASPSLAWDEQTR